MTAELVLLNLAIAFAGVVQASAGLGFAMVANPLLALINITYLPGPMLFANLFLSMAILYREGASLDRKETSPLLAGLLIGTVIGGLILTQVAAEKLGLVFGMVILLAVAWSIFSPALPLTKRTILYGASAAGVSGIVAAMHAPPLVSLYQREDAAKVRATFAVVFVAGCTMALAGLWISGRFGMAQVFMGLSLLPGIALGFICGRFIAMRVTQQRARIGMLTISGLGGLALVVKSL